MEKNVGSMDKNIRLIVGILILIIGAIAGSWWGLIGLVLVATGLYGFCPAYVPFKFSTIKKKENS